MMDDKPTISHSAPPIAVSINEGGRLTGLSRAEIYEAINDGRIEARKAGTRTLLLFESISRFIQDLPRYGDVPPPTRIEAAIKHQRARRRVEQTRKSA